MKILFALALFFLSISCASQEVRYNNFSIGGGYTVQTDRSTEIGFTRSQDSLVEFRIVPDEYFRVEVERNKLSSSTFCIFQLPAGSDRTIVLLRKSNQDTESISRVRTTLQGLYVSYVTYQARQGYQDITFEQNSLGDWRFRRENNWVSGLDGIKVIGNFMILTQGFEPNRFPLGAPPTKMFNRTERVKRDTGGIIGLAKEAGPVRKESGPGIVPVGK